MQIEFQLSLEEFAEASRFHQRPTAAHLRTLRPLALVSAIAIIIAAFGYAAAQERWGFAAHPGEPADPTMNYLVLPLIPWVAFLGSSLLVLWRRGVRRSSKPWEGENIAEAAPKKRSASRITKGEFAATLSVIGYAAVFVFTQYTRDPRTGSIMPSPTFAGLAVVPLIFWGVFQSWAFAANRISVRRAIPDAWAMQTQLQRPLRMEFTTDGVTIETLFSHCQYKWEYFPGCRETSSLFLLYVSPAMFHIIPMRAFASEADVAGLRTMLRDLPGQRPSAFPVIPIPPSREPISEVI